MPRSRPASNPLSFHKPTGQYYVTRGGRRIYLGANRDDALAGYHRLGLGMAIPVRQEPVVAAISVKELANRFLAAQKANWRNPEATLESYRYWIARFLKDHAGLKAAELTVELFAEWKLSLRRRKYAPESINHFLSVVRAMYAFAEDTELIEKSPRLNRVRNEAVPLQKARTKAIYSPKEIAQLLDGANTQLRGMVLMALNCGFGLKDIHDLQWSDIDGNQVTLARSKTGISQTFALWPETLAALEAIRTERKALVARLAKRGRARSDRNYVFVTRYWRPWNKDAITGQFKKLCKKAKVKCYGFYRLRHCVSTAISSVASPHVQRQFMRHARLQQQVTYTHLPDEDVTIAIMKARDKLLQTDTTT